VVGIDIDRRMLRAAAARATHAQVPIRFVEGRVEQLPFRDAAFDVDAISSALPATGGRACRSRSMTSEAGSDAGLDSGPACSQANRFSARMAIGRSLAKKRPSSSTRGIVPRRQAASQGAPQMRPQMEAKGLGPRAIR
jgi:hypothetical protein